MRNFVATLAYAAALVLAPIATARAQETVPLSLTVGGLRTVQFMPLQFANKQGYFKREGLDVDIVSLNAGPAIVSAIVSGSVQVGYASPIPVIFARAQNQPVRIFNALTMANPATKAQWNSLVSSEKSGVKSIKELSGKTIALNASGGACELQFRESMANTGVSFEAIDKIIVPFPQMQTALELGNADATCIVEPFRTNMRLSPRLKANILSSGTLTNAISQYPEDVLFVREDWGNANKEALRRFNRGLEAVFNDFKKDPQLFKGMLVEDFKLSVANVNSMTEGMEFANVQVTAVDIRPLIEGLLRYKMLKAPLNPDDLVLQVN